MTSISLLKLLYSYCNRNLLSYAYHLLQGKAETHIKNALIYILLIIPHELLHYPDLFLVGRSKPLRTRE